MLWLPRALLSRFELRTASASWPVPIEAVDGAGGSAAVPDEVGLDLALEETEGGGVLVINFDSVLRYATWAIVVGVGLFVAVGVVAASL